VVCEQPAGMKARAQFPVREWPCARPRLDSDRGQVRDSTRGAGRGQSGGRAVASLARDPPAQPARTRPGSINDRASPELHRERPVAAQPGDGAAAGTRAGRADPRAQPAPARRRLRASLPGGGPGQRAGRTGARGARPHARRSRALPCSGDGPALERRHGQLRGGCVSAGCSASGRPGNRPT
jgi:hypothetical protein